MEVLNPNKSQVSRERGEMGNWREEEGNQTEFLSLLWIIFVSVGFFTALVFAWQWNKRLRLRMEVEMEEELESAITRKALWEVAMERRLRSLKIAQRRKASELLSFETGDSTDFSFLSGVHNDRSDSGASPLQVSALPPLSLNELKMGESDISDRLLCVVCRTEEKNTVLEPCRHLCLCRRCTLTMLQQEELFVCPLCRTPVQATFLVHT